MAERSKLWYLKNINLFHGMSEEQMRMVEQRTVMRRSGGARSCTSRATPATASTF